ncbi:acyltransferase family protein [Methylobacterium tarhaniae]|uniref:acyltransferase family protein n=1 Tax=Methylobacterium tarhaniae TaxID=1187852 RepID=UPI000A64DD0D|nr:acyltransferase [Methylobacterium tarhaniae]
MQPDRLSHLDGLRGFAALSVVLFHFMSALVPFLVPEQQGNAAWISYSPIAVLWNGTFAVSVFFVLSGFVLTNASQRKSDPLWVNVVIRYLRLAVPALLSTIFGWILLNILPTQASALHEITHSRWLLWTYQGDIPNFLIAIYSGAIEIFSRGGSYFNNVLWTMRPELFGSILCFIVCLCKNARNRIIISSIFFIIIFISKKYEYESFIIGIYLREAWIARQLTSKFATLAMMIGLIIGSQSGDSADKLGLDWLPEFLAVGTKNSMLYPMAAGLVVYGCIVSTTAAYALSGKLGSFLGSISFPLYLIHVPIIYTIFSYLYLLTFDSKIYQFLVFTFVFAAMIFLAYTAEVFVERPFLRKLGKLRHMLNDMNSHLRGRSRRAT